MSDQDSHPSTYEPCHAETVSSQRMIGKPMSPAAKRRVDRATCSHPELSGKRCLIENTDDSNDVGYVHCLPRQTKESLLDSLEFAWNMPRFTLNVDSRYNVILLSSKFRTLFDSGRWLLLPETSIIDIYDDAIKRGQKFPIIDRPVYRYTLLTHRDMLLVPIHRQNSLPTDEETPPVDFTLYTYPYYDFPTIVSHIHPRFVICNTGAKLMSPIWPEDIRTHDMMKILYVWKAWSQVVDSSQPGAQAFLKTSSNLA